MLSEVGELSIWLNLLIFGSTKQALDYAKIVHEMYLEEN